MPGTATTTSTATNGDTVIESVAQLRTLLSLEAQKSDQITFEIISRDDAIKRYSPRSCGTSSDTAAISMWEDPQQVRTMRDYAALVTYE